MPKYGNIIFIIFLAALIHVLIRPLAVERCRGGGCLLCGGVCVLCRGLVAFVSSVLPLGVQIDGSSFPSCFLSKDFPQKRSDT